MLREFLEVFSLKSNAINLIFPLSKKQSFCPLLRGVSANQANS